MTTLSVKIKQGLVRLAETAVRVASEIQTKQAALLDEARKCGLVAATPEQQRAGFEPAEGLMSEFRAILLANWCAIQPTVYYVVEDATAGKIRLVGKDDKGAVALTAEYAVALTDPTYRKIGGDAGDLSTLKGQVGKFRKAGSTHVSNIVKMIERLAKGGAARGGTQDRLEFWAKMNPAEKKGLARKVKSACETAGINPAKFEAAWALFIADLKKA